MSGGTSGGDDTGDLGDASGVEGVTASLPDGDLLFLFFFIDVTEELLEADDADRVIGVDRHLEEFDE